MACQDLQQVFKPGQEDIMGCLPVATTLAAVHAHTTLHQLCPGAVKLIQHPAVKTLAVNDPGLYRQGRIIRIFPYPAGTVVGDIMGVIAPAALSQR